MEPVSEILLLKALDGLSARAAASAQNIANANTQGYRPVHVDFEQALASATALGPGEIAKVTPRMHIATPGEPLRVDLELADASATTARYSALVELLGRQLQLEALAATGNK